MSRLIILFAALLFAGCHRDATTNESVGTAMNTANESNSEPDPLRSAKELLRGGKLDAAADAAYQALIADPNNHEASLIASEIEAARANCQKSAELAASIDLRSRFGQRAVELHAEQLIKLDRPSAAADVLIAGLAAMPEMLAWRHQVWSLLNRVGRRQEASQQADLLCRAGQATPSELVSLLRRGDAFPPKFSRDEDPQRHFQGGLGMATWYFTQREYRQALAELAGERDAGFPTPAACALYGRLLAETQAVEQFPAWYVACREEHAEFSDYWAALGTYLFDQHEFEASARALMEAVVRDPTDEWSVHRLARVFDALGRREDAEQFRERGIVLAQIDQDAEQLAAQLAQTGATDTDLRRNLPRKLMELGRPFEALGWTLANLPAAAAGPRNAVAGKLAELSRDQDALAMASEMSLVGLERDLFGLDQALTTLRQAAPLEAAVRPSDAQPLAGPRLANVADKVGLDFQWYQDEQINLASIPIHEMMGGGIAVIDYDRDGWPDVYLGQGSGDPPTDACTRSSLLFRNLGARFAAVTDPAGAADFNYSTGIAAGDVNQDGFTDLLLGSLGRNRLLVNNGDGTFRDATDQLGEIPDCFTSSLAIADINADALPDLFEAVYLDMKGGFKLPEVGPDGRELQPTPLAFFPAADRWFENSGDGSFRSQVLAMEMAELGTSLGVVVTDFDGNGGNEVFVGNDARPNHYLVQTGKNRFSNTAAAAGLASGFGGDANACMGIATGDFNRDGTLDLHITNFLKESANHYLQTSSGGFTDFAARYGMDQLSMPYVGFGTKAIDIDRNGWLDLIVSNGHVFDRRHLGEPFQMPPQFLINQGNRFEQVEVEDDSGYWDGAYLGRTVAMTDFDQDGLMDFYVGHLDQPLALLHNQTQSTGHWIQLELVGTDSERDAIGTRIEITLGNERLCGWVTAGDGYLCSDEPVVDLGLGDNQRIDQLRIWWPSGNVQSFASPAVDHRYLVIEGDAEIYLRH